MSYRDELAAARARVAALERELHELRHGERSARRIVEVVIAGLGAGSERGMLSRWLVGPDERVEADQAIAEVVTSRATVEIPAPATGILLERCRDAGDQVLLGDVIAFLAKLGAPASVAAENARRQRQLALDDAVATLGKAAARWPRRRDRDALGAAIQRVLALLNE